MNSRGNLKVKDVGLATKKDFEENVSRFKSYEEFNFKGYFENVEDIKEMLIKDGFVDTKEGFSDLVEKKFGKRIQLFRYKNRYACFITNA